MSLVIGSVILLLFKRRFKFNLVSLAKSELKKWRNFNELSQEMSQTLVNYWKSVGINFSLTQMQSKRVQSSYPWSSAFISYLFFKSGAKERFPYSAAHSGYFGVAKRNRDNPKAFLRGFRISEYAPKVGDLVVYTRKKGMGYDSKGFFPSHGELVVQVGKGFIKTIGGNVSNKVKESTFKINEKGYLEGNRVSFFMVIQNNIR